MTETTTSVQDRAWQEYISHLRENGIPPERVHHKSVTTEGYQELVVPAQVDSFTGRVKTKYRRWPDGVDVEWLIAALGLSRR